MTDQDAIFQHLQHLTNQELLILGSNLGLYYPYMQNTTRLNEMVSHWLNGEDNVLDVSGLPSWASLAKSLRKSRLHDLADAIENAHSDSVSQQGEF